LRLSFSADGLAKVLEDINAEANPGLEADKWTKVVTLHQIWTWLEGTEPECKEFSKRYARARERQAEFLGDLMMAEAQKSRIGEYRKQFREVDAQGKTLSSKVEVRQDDNVQRSRLVVDAIDKRMKQLAPKKYRDTGRDDGGEGTGNEQLEELVKALAAGPAPADPEDPSANLGTTKPDFSRDEIEGEGETAEDKKDEDA